MAVSTTLILAGIGVSSLVCQWLAWRVRMPAILFLLAGGILAGPVTGFLQPEAIFDDLLFPVISLAVAIILFEGSLTLRYEEIKGHGKMGGVERGHLLVHPLTRWCSVVHVFNL